RCSAARQSRALGEGASLDELFAGSAASPRRRQTSAEGDTPQVPGFLHARRRRACRDSSVRNAQHCGRRGGGGMNALIVIVILFALFWLLLLRPQRRRAAEQRELMSSLEPGDEIVSTGGIYGVITSIDGEEVHVEIANGIVIRMARGAVAGLVERDEEPEETESDEDQETVKAGDEPPNPS